LLTSAPKVHPRTGTLELMQEDSNLFNALEQGSIKFQYAMVLSRKCGKKAEMERKVDEDLLDVFEV